MPVTKNKVLLLKAESETTSDKFSPLLIKNNFIVVHVKTLEFAYTNLEHLKQKLDTPSSYSGLIFTTPRSVGAVSKALGASVSISSVWKEKQNFVVGETTKEAASRLGLACEGHQSGNANNLADYISAQSYSLPFLFPCGSLSDTSIETFRLKSIPVEPVTVYATLPNSDIDQEFRESTTNYSEAPEFVVFFSPSGVSAALKCLERFRDDDLSSIKFVAIGPTTEGVMKEAGLEVEGVAEKPTPEELLKVLLKN